MSQQPVRREQPGRYERSSGGLLGALLVTVVAVTAFVGVRSVITPDRDQAVRTVDWEAQVRAGRADAKLVVAAPATLPDGWRATTATYLTGSDPSWQLGLLTDDERYVGVYESLRSTSALVEQHVDEDAEQGEDVEVAGETWEVWTDRDGDYGLVRKVPEPVGEEGTLLVAGSADEADVRRLAESLVLDGE